MNNNYYRTITFLLLVIFLNCFHPLIAQVPRWEDFREDLSVNAIVDFVITSDDEAWVLNGSNLLQLKDKKQFKKILVIDDIQPDHVEIDATDHLWLVSQNNFQYEGNHLAYATYKDGTLTTFLREDIAGFPNDNSSNDDNITSFYIDPNDSKWFGFENGDVGKLEITNQYVHYPNSFINEDVRDMAIDPTDGSLYVTVQYDLYRISNGNWSEIAQSWTNSSFLETVEVTSTGEVYFAGWNGVHQLDGTGVITYDKDNSNIPFNRIHDIEEVDGNIFYLGKDEEVDYVLDEDFNIIYQGLSDRFSQIRTNFIIKGTNPLDIWLGSNNDGLVQITNTGNAYFNNQTISLPIGSNDYANETVFVGEKAFIATDGGLTIKKDSLYDGLHPYYSIPSVGLPGDGKSNSVAYDSLSSVFVATDSGLAKLNVITLLVESIIDLLTPGITSERFYKVFPLKKGVVLAVNDDQYLVIDNGAITKNKNLNTVGLPAGYGWNGLVPDISGSSIAGFWLGANTGFYYFDFATLTDYNSDVYHTNVTALAQATDGTLWMGFDYYGEYIQSFDGIDQWDEFTLPDLSTAYIDEQDIVDLEFDYAGTLWVLAQFKTSGGSRVTKLLEYKNDVFTIMERQANISDYSNDLAISPSGEKWICSLDSYRSLSVYIDDSYSYLDQCLPVNCPEGTQCVDGECIPLDDACSGIVCAEGYTCYQGSCYPVCTDEDPCDPNSICIDNRCVPAAGACDYMSCPEGNICVYGECYPFNPFNDNVLNLSGNLLVEISSGGRIAEYEPINGATIYLFNESQTEINQFATTDAEGKFNFEKLSPGTYKVFVDYPTYKVKGDGLIILKSNIKNTNLDIVLVSEEYELRLAYVTGLAEDFANRGVFTLYPNPSHGKIMLSAREDIGKVNIRISDVTGKLVQQINMMLPKSEELLITDLQGEPAGLKVIGIYQKGQLIHESTIIYKPE